MEKSAIDWIAGILVIIGAINWGLYGTIKTDLVASLLGTTMLAKIAYILVGVSGLWVAYKMFTMSK